VLAGTLLAEPYWLTFHCNIQIQPQSAVCAIQVAAGTTESCHWQVTHHHIAQLLQGILPTTLLCHGSINCILPLNGMQDQGVVGFCFTEQYIIQGQSSSAW